MRRHIRDALIAIGLWPGLRSWLRWGKGEILLQLTRIGLHNPKIFLTPTADQLARLRDFEIRAQSANTAASLLMLLEPLVSNASPLAEPTLAKIRQFRLPKDVLLHIECLERRIAAIRSLPDLALILSDTPALTEFSRPQGFQLFPYPGSRKLIVVFTTIFNNFDVSNAVLYALLKRFEVSILILKDPTICTYGSGVLGLGDDPEQLGQSITELARSIDCDELYITGFSSGGYSSLLLSYLINCKGYLGFSVRTGSGYHGDPLPRRPIFNAAQKYWIKKRVPERFQVNLRKICETRVDDCHRKLIIGAKDEIDLIHAHDVAHCPGFELLTLENCGHQTVSATIERGMIDGLLTRLFHR